MKSKTKHSNGILIFYYKPENDKDTDILKLYAYRHFDIKYNSEGYTYTDDGDKKLHGYIMGALYSIGKTGTKKRSILSGFKKTTVTNGALKAEVKKVL